MSTAHKRTLTYARTDFPHFFNDGSNNFLQQPVRVPRFLQSFRNIGVLFLVDLFAVMIVTSIALGWLVGYQVPRDFGAMEIIAGVGLHLFMAFMLLGLYSSAAMDAVTEFRRISAATTLTFGSCFLVAVYFGWIHGFIGWLLPMLWLSTLLLIVAGRSLIRSAFSHFSWWGHPAVVIGNNEDVEKVLHLLQSGRHGVRAALVIDRKDSIAEGLKKAKAEGIQWAVLVGDRRNFPDWMRDVIGKFSNLMFVVPPQDDDVSMLMRQPLLGALRGIQIKDRLLLPSHQLVKRAIDIAVSLLVGIVLLPVLVVVALLVRLSSKGPIFYSHQRIGRAGTPFRVWKFRTMVIDADRKLEEYLRDHPELREEWEKNHKLLYDPRITRVGQLLRKYSLDELPQIWNILKGEMSLVGPRPIVMAETSRYADSFKLYKQVTPGVTGLWQVSGRSNTSYAFRVALDTYYVRNWSLWLDLYILLCTFKAVVRGDGAC